MTVQGGPHGIERIAAETVRPDPINPKIRQMEVIDTDFHFTPDWATLSRYLKEPFKSRLFSYPAISSEYNPECANGKPGTGQDVMGRARTALDVLRICDANGVDTVVINPGLTRPQSMFNEPFIAAVAAAYNDYLIGEVFPVSDRIRATMMICHRDPAMGAAEIRRVGHHKQFVSFFTEFGGAYESLGADRFDPIFAAAKDMGNLPMTAHTGGYLQQFSPLWESSRSWVELFGNQTAADCIMHLGAYILQGLFDSYPDLKILMQEGGFYWIPDVSLRLDDFYISHPHDIALVERKLASGERYLKKLPSEYIIDHMRFSTQPMPVPKRREDWRMMMTLCHAKDLFCYSSDWPHQTFDPANWVVENPDVIDPAMQTAILAGNAKKLYSRL